MKTLKLIDISDEGEVTFDPSMEARISGQDAAIQRTVMALLTTAGTKIDAPQYGGSAKKLTTIFKGSDNKKVKMQVTDVVKKAERTLFRHEQSDYGEYQITGLSVQNISREPDFEVDLRIDFIESEPANVTIPTSYDN